MPARKVGKVPLGVGSGQWAVGSSAKTFSYFEESELTVGLVPAEA